jgi:hypothetical protein
MSKLFQNGVESEIVAGYFNGESLEGLYLNGNYFSFKKKASITVYYGNVYNTDPDDENRNSLIDTTKMTDAQLLAQIIGDDADAKSEVVASPYDFEFTYDWQMTKGNDFYGWHFFAVPTEFAPETAHIIEKQTKGDQVPLLKREIEIDGVAYTVFCGYGDAVPITNIYKEN